MNTLRTKEFFREKKNEDGIKRQQRLKSYLYKRKTNVAKVPNLTDKKSHQEVHLALVKLETKV